MEDLSEKEQLDAIRAWWAENGSYVMGGIVVGIVVIFGWNRWQTSVADTETAASTLFEEIMEAAELNLVDNAEPPAETLFSEYSDSPYAAQARLAMTRLYMDSGRDQDAADVLRPLAEMPPTDELALVGRLRMTQILLYQDKPQEVADLVEGLPNSGFSARFSEALGDAYVMLERYVDAEAAYMAASSDDPLAPTVDVTMLQLKINDLPSADQIAAEAVEAPTAEDDAVEDSDDESAAGADTPADDAPEQESE